MTGLIIATSILGSLFVAAVVVGAIKIHTLEKQVTSVAECFLLYLTNNENVDIIEDITVTTGKGGPTFPNSEGF